MKFTKSKASEAIDAYIKANVATMTYKAMASHLNISSSAVKSRAMRMGVQKYEKGKQQFQRIEVIGNRTIHRSF